MLEKAIPSKEYRDYIIKNNIVLTDWQMATLIYNNHQLYYEDMMKALLDLANATLDMDLRRQIAERYVRDNEYFERFKQSGENAYYELKNYYKNKFEMNGIYKDFESAYSAGINEGEKFRISKECYVCEYNVGNIEGVFGTVEFNPDGTVGVWFNLYKLGKEDKFYDIGVPRFETGAIDLPLCFRKGDIVKIIGTDIYGIVEEPASDEEEERNREFVRRVDCSDFQVCVNEVFDGKKYLGIFEHKHVAPSQLEYAKFDDNDIRRDFLTYMVKTMSHNSLFGGTGRDEGRMEMILDKIRTVWKQYPDMRFGQLLLNVCGPKDLFVIEDEMLMECIEND